MTVKDTFRFIVAIPQIVLFISYLYILRINYDAQKIFSQNSLHVVVTGIARLWRGATSVADGLWKYKSIRTTFNYLEVNPIYTLDTDPHHAVESSPKNSLLNWIAFTKLIKVVNPSHIDYYFHLNINYQLGQLIALRVLNYPFVAICTGAEILSWENHSWIKKLLIKRAMKYARAVVLKELYMEDIIIKYSIVDREKIVHVHNTIEVGSEPIYERSGKVVLFLNTFKKFRNVDLLVKAAPLVLKDYPEAKFLLVGSTGREEEGVVARLIVELGLEKQVHILPFTKSADGFFIKASVFVLPADIVYLNNALLEAMGHGVPPIISNVQGSDKIVDNGRNGLIVERTPEGIAEAITYLFGNERIRVNMAIQARTKIKTCFNESARSEKLYSLYNSLVWK